MSCAQVQMVLALRQLQELGRMPASSANEQVVAVQHSGGHIYNVMLRGGTSAADAASQINAALVNTDITAEAIMRVELSDFADAGKYHLVLRAKIWNQ